ncbi:uncharacterized protein Z518_04234 [Rhinocladiella mackenziei CBS 650.93]|uniref:Rhinocladiella mackenziei CBS 650.93 unplaced genomic scaffold supercont1.3, whole genome shotgun sequence n=1 Tax=Rhinocladiella mackenziei CBS 650.93 TaxID=1442369 RepID=A0A0D2IKL5_9EURO|nr:uncharacterized protein Z518_04234 [Rhinocladiella mackenziei CBS 650.93]KIX06259.1 hypothetical protein Z518_04234 [Rhinocladiella mackenziei CBS 650.93]
MPVHHISLPVPFSQVDAEVSFLVAAFGHMDIKEFMRPVPGVVGMGDDRPFLWIVGLDKKHEPVPDDAQITRIHLALSAKDRSQVDAFHAAALKAGGTCNGPPGLRPEYHSDYYGAFVISPGGHNIEAVVHGPPAGEN